MRAVRMVAALVLTVVEDPVVVVVLVEDLVAAVDLAPDRVMEPRRPRANPGARSRRALPLPEGRRAEGRWVARMRLGQAYWVSAWSLRFVARSACEPLLQPAW